MANLKLTDAQLVLLSAASQHDDGLVVLTDAPSSASQTIAALLRKDLLTELVVQRRQPHWRQNDSGEPIGLRLTKRGYAAIGAETDERGGGSVATPIDTSGSFRPGTKQSMVIYMLKRPTGATISDLIGATGWLPHTTRAALSGLRKKGFSLTSERPEGCERRYLLVSPTGISE